MEEVVVEPFVDKNKTLETYDDTTVNDLVLLKPEQIQAQVDTVPKILSLEEPKGFFNINFMKKVHYFKFLTLYCSFRRNTFGRTTRRKKIK